jgi:hypothetical protein
MSISDDVRAFMDDNDLTAEMLFAALYEGDYDEIFSEYEKSLPGFDKNFIHQCTITFLTLPQALLARRVDNMLLVPVFLVLSSLQYSKEGTYGRSWCKRGEMDIFFNLARKFDRLENMMINGAKDEVGEGKIDTVGDNANYGLLWMTHFLREKPEEFTKWVNDNC